jgi:TolB-like protein
VLPLQNLSGDSQDYFADGMTDELITHLGQISALRVISRTSVMTYKGVRKPLAEIARELNVEAVVEGSVLRSGERVRVTAQLIEVPADRHMWAQSYEGDIRDTLALQSRVARSIAEQIRGTLKPQEQAALEKSKAVNPEAYEAYLRTVFLEQRRRWPARPSNISIRRSRRAIYAEAYSGLARTLRTIGDWEYGVLSLRSQSQGSGDQGAGIDEPRKAHTSLAFALTCMAGTGRRRGGIQAGHQPQSRLCDGSSLVCMASDGMGRNGEGISS